MGKLAKKQEINKRGELRLKVRAPAFIPLPMSELPRAKTSSAWHAASILMQMQQQPRLTREVAEERLRRPIELKQFAIVFKVKSRRAFPIAFLSWANLSASVERRYLANPERGLWGYEWNSGDRMWLIDFVANHGHLLEIRRILQPLFARHSARYVRGFRVGNAIQAEGGKGCPHPKQAPRLTSVGIFIGSELERQHALDWWGVRPIKSIGKRKSQDEAKTQDPAGATPISLANPARESAGSHQSRSTTTCKSTPRVRSTYAPKTKLIEERRP